VRGAAQHAARHATRAAPGGGGPLCRAAALSRRRSAARLVRLLLEHRRAYCRAGPRPIAGRAAAETLARWSARMQAYAAARRDTPGTRKDT